MVPHVGPSWNTAVWPHCGRRDQCGRICRDPVEGNETRAHCGRVNCRPGRFWARLARSENEQRRRHGRAAARAARTRRAPPQGAGRPNRGPEPPDCTGCDSTRTRTHYFEDRSRRQQRHCHAARQRRSCLRDCAIVSAATGHNGVSSAPGYVSVEGACGHVRIRDGAAKLPAMLRSSCWHVAACAQVICPAGRRPSAFRQARGCHAS